MIMMKLRKSLTGSKGFAWTAANILILGIAVFIFMAVLTSLIPSIFPGLNFFEFGIIEAFTG